MDAATRDYIRFQRSEIMRAMVAPPRRKAHQMETHEEWVIEIETAIAEYRKVFPTHASILDKRVKNLIALSA